VPPLAPLKVAPAATDTLPLPAPLGMLSLPDPAASVPELTIVSPL